jgi:hypothetical protein
MVRQDRWAEGLEVVAARRVALFDDAGSKSYGVHGAPRGSLMTTEQTSTRHSVGPSGE